jgi:uncharacterized protein
MDGIDEAEILSMPQTMIKQRRESIAQFEQGGRLELAQQEQEEIGIIEGFLPKQMGDADAAKAVADLIAELGAASIKDKGRTMAALRERFAGQIDFTKASLLVKQALTKERGRRLTRLGGGEHRIALWGGHTFLLGRDHA